MSFDAKQKKIIKNSNSKGQLIKYISVLQQALNHYSNENHWAVRGEEILWIGDDDPTYAAQFSLGIRKRDPEYNVRNKKEDGDGRNNPKQETPKHGGADPALVNNNKADADSEVRGG
jgi:hypothetical protein